MEYKVINKEFGGQPLAGYMMNVIDLTRDKDGLDAIAFLKKIDKVVDEITEESLADDGKLKEFFFVIATEEDTFAMDFFVARTINEIANKDYVDGWEYEEVKYYRMYTEDEEWGLDEIALFDGNVTEDKQMDRRTMEMVMTFTRMFDDYSSMGTFQDKVDQEKMLDMDCDERDDFIINFVEMAIEKNVDDYVEFFEKMLMESFEPERQFALVEVKVTRIRKVLEKATIKIAVSKENGEIIEELAERYAENNYNEESSALDWEEEDDEYEFTEYEVEESDVVDTDILDNLDYDKIID